MCQQYFSGPGLKVGRGNMDCLLGCRGKNKMDLGVLNVNDEIQTHSS